MTDRINDGPHTGPLTDGRLPTVRTRVRMSPCDGAGSRFSTTASARSPRSPGCVGCCARCAPRSSPGTVFHEVEAKSALNRVPGSSPVPFRWTVNPYRGCSHACVYCLGGPTRVLLADGRVRPIAELRVGDAVLGTEVVDGQRRYVRPPCCAHWSTRSPPTGYGWPAAPTWSPAASTGSSATAGWRHVARGWCRAGRRPRCWRWAACCWGPVAPVGHAGPPPPTGGVTCAGWSAPRGRRAVVPVRGAGAGGLGAGPITSSPRTAIRRSRRLLPPSRWAVRRSRAASAAAAVRPGRGERSRTWCVAAPAWADWCAGFLAGVVDRPRRGRSGFRRAADPHRRDRERRDRRPDRRRRDRLGFRFVPAADAARGRGAAGRWGRRVPAVLPGHRSRRCSRLRDLGGAPVTGGPALDRGVGASRPACSGCTTSPPAPATSWPRAW